MEPHKRGQMLSFTRAHYGVVCCICNHPRGANLADAAILKNSKCNVLKLSTFPAGVLLPFCNLFQSSTGCHLQCSGAQPPPPQFENHGQRSEHTGFLTVHRLFCFASCLHYEIAGGVGGGRPPICKTWTRIRTHISSCTPLMDACCSVFCDVFDFRDNCSLQYAYSSKRRKYSNLRYSFVPF